MRGSLPPVEGRENTLDGHKPVKSRSDIFSGCDLYCGHAAESTEVTLVSVWNNFTYKTSKPEVELLIDYCKLLGLTLARIHYITIFLKTYGLGECL